MTMPTRLKKRGFGSMEKIRHRQIASEGGKRAHDLGLAHEWNFEEAQKAGRLGGLAISKTRQHMSEIGRRGGLAKGRAYSR